MSEYYCTGCGTMHICNVYCSTEGKPHENHHRDCPVCGGAGLAPRLRCACAVTPGKPCTCSSDIDSYQRWTMETAVYRKATTAWRLYAALGLAEEAGEVAGVIKRQLRDNNHNRAKLVEELGDALWYLARVADESGIPMSEVISTNRTKLAGRAKRGTLHGSGDR